MTNPTKIPGLWHGMVLIEMDRKAVGSRATSSQEIHVHSLRSCTLCDQQSSALAGLAPDQWESHMACCKVDGYPDQCPLNVSYWVHPITVDAIHFLLEPANYMRNRLPVQSRLTFAVFLPRRGDNGQCSKLLLKDKNTTFSRDKDTTFLLWSQNPTQVQFI
jgi:hypothetical protein